MAEKAIRSISGCVLPDDPEQSVNRFIIVAAKRARQLQNGARPFLPTTAKKSTYQIDPGPSENMFVDFLHSVVDGTPCRFPKEDAYAMTEIVLKARDAADKKELITLGSDQPAAAKPT